MVKGDKIRKGKRWGRGTEGIYPSAQGVGCTPLLLIKIYDFEFLLFGELIRLIRLL